MLKEIDAVLFDLDGSLVDSMWLWRDIDIEYLGRYGIPLPEGLQADIEGMSFSETAVCFKERFQIPESVAKIKEDWNRMAWEKYTHQVPLKAGAEGFLQICRKRGIRLGIASSNSRELIEAVLNAHGILDLFESIVTGCDVERGKPAPDVYLEAARQCKALPEHCLVFEDIVAGIMAGKAAGMKVCAVEDVYSRYQEQEKRKLADYYIKDFTEIIGQPGTGRSH
ncbi:MAG: HAD family phosphatase [Lachnospiraceae bacterium]|nr:HAD family phosphatase [Lachnospiraceae bacterium]